MRMGGKVKFVFYNCERWSVGRIVVWGVVLQVLKENFDLFFEELDFFLKSLVVFMKVCCCYWWFNSVGIEWIGRALQECPVRLNLDVDASRIATLLSFGDSMILLLNPTSCIGLAFRFLPFNYKRIPRERTVLVKKLMH
jgi:hypothetical protein